jgi:hypothetical protein
MASQGLLGSKLADSVCGELCWRATAHVGGDLCWHGLGDGRHLIENRVILGSVSSIVVA